MSTRVRGLVFLFFVAHFAASVYVVLTSIGANMAFLETGPQIAPNPLLELAAEVLPFPTLPIALSLPSGVSRLVPWWAPLMVNSVFWAGTAFFLTSKRVGHARAA